MIRPRRVLALILALAALVSLAGFVALATPQGAAPAAKRAPLYSHPVHRGSSGKQVALAQRVLAGKKPAKYPDIHPFRGRKVTGQFGKFTAKAVLRARWLLGEPITYRAYCHCRPGKRARFDRDLYLLLTGKRARPLGWFGRRAKRIALADRVEASRASSAAARLIVRIAQHEVGVQEHPIGSNRGYRVAVFQSSTGAYAAAWCDSFVMWDWKLAKVWPFTRLAYVYGTVQQARDHVLLRSVPIAGAGVAYTYWEGRIRIRSGHIGIVERVTRDGFWTIEGNSHDAVTRHFRRFGDTTVFIYPPVLLRHH